MPAKLTIKEVREYFKSKKCELLAEEYIDSKKPLKFLCYCGKKDSKPFEKFKSRNSCCRDCGIEKRNNSRKLSFEQVKATFKENGCELLETKYINSKTKMLYKCKCGNISRMSYENMRTGQHCRLCSYKKTAESLRKYTLEDVSEIFKAQGCQLLEKEFNNINDVLKYNCVCGRVSKIRLDSFLSGARCKKCAIENSIGQNNPNWKKEKTDEDRLKGRKFREYEIWRRGVFVRDNYTCCACGKIGNKLVAHHLDGWHWCLEKRLDLNNGITLCKACHDNFHEEYGKRNNTQEQYKQWIKGKNKKVS